MYSSHIAKIGVKMRKLLSLVVPSYTPMRCRNTDIVFDEDPVRLYKMAYLQRVLERSLYLQLEWAIGGSKQAFLTRRIFGENQRVG